MKSKILRKLREEKGESVITFSLLMPILAGLLGLLITIFSLMYTKIIVVDSNRDGARHEALNMDATTGVTTEQVIRNGISYGNLASDGSIVSVDVNDSSNYVTVATQYYLPSLIPQLPKLFGGSEYPDKFTIEAKTAFKKERY